MRTNRQRTPFGRRTPAGHGTTLRRRTVLLGATTAAALAATGALTAVVASAAAAGCRVDYPVTNQWQGGFGASVTITNLGDPINGWTLTWTFTAGQTITQAWNATVDPERQPRSRPRTSATTARSPPTPAPRSASTAPGTTTNPVPTAFALNGSDVHRLDAPTTPAGHHRADRRPTPPVTPRRRPPRRPRRRAGARADGGPRPGPDQRPVRQRQLGLLAAAGHRAAGDWRSTSTAAPPGELLADHQLHQLLRHRRRGRTPSYTVRAGGQRRRAGRVRAVAAASPAATSTCRSSRRRHHAGRRAYTYAANDA